MDKAVIQTYGKYSGGNVKKSLLVFLAVVQTVACLDSAGHCP